MRGTLDLMLLFGLHDVMIMIKRDIHSPQPFHLRDLGPTNASSA